MAGPLSDALEANIIHESHDEFSSELASRIGPLAWEFGRNPQNGRFTFTLSAEGIQVRHLLAHYWLEQQIEVPGWDFHSTRQPLTPEQLDNVALLVGESAVAATDLQLDAQVDENSRKLNIQVWHPAFETLPEQERMKIVFLMLDAAFGERGTQTKIGSIDIYELDKFVSLEKVVAFTDYSWSERGWKSPGPLNDFHMYQNAKPSEAFRRSDTIAGGTVIPNFLFPFMSNGAVTTEDPLADCGGGLIYLKLNFSPLDPKSAAGIRARVEDGLRHKLEQRRAGAYVLGGSTGLNFSYIDLAIFDREKSLESVREILPVLGVDGGYTIEWFATR